MKTCKHEGDLDHEITPLKIKEMKEAGTYYLPKEDKIALAEDWDEYKAKCLI